MDSRKLQSAILAFIKSKKTNSAYHVDNLAEHNAFCWLVL